MMKKIALTLLATAAVTAGASAQLLTAFDVSGSGTTSTSPTPVVGTTVTATGLQRNTVVFASAANSFNSNTWNITNTLNTSSNYIYFDVTTTASTTFSTLQFAINGSNSAPNQGQWAYTLDGGGTFTLGTAGNGAFTNVNAAPTSQQLWDFADFTLAPGATVEFRFYEYGTTSINGGTAAVGGTTRIANISGVGNPQYDLLLSGPNAFTQPVNVAVPEPTAWAAMAGGAGLLGLVIFRRNRKTV